jgi:hypothetical protein
VAPLAQPSVPSRCTCVISPTRRGPKSSRKRRVKPSLSGLCTNLKNLRNKSCSGTAVDLNDRIERIFNVILDDLSWKKRCLRKCRRGVRSAPIRIAGEGVTMRGWRERNLIRVRSRCCRMRPTSGGKPEMSAPALTAATADGHFVSYDLRI